MKSPVPGRLRFIAIWSTLVAIGIGVAVFKFRATRQKPSSTRRAASRSATEQDLRRQSFEKLTVWWDEIPESVRAEGVPTGSESNIHPDDYAGPEACKNCHKKQFESWTTHPHRLMNALVENATIRGDFSDHRISYLGGDVTFHQADGQYRMRLERGDVRRECVINQTIGSRFFQYYIGKQLEGPEPPDHPLYSEDHVLPLGYWIDRQEWVPIVHVFPESPESARHDPFVKRPAHPEDFHEYADHTPDLYRSQCNFCHTTFPIGDMFLRLQKTFGNHIPTQLDLSLSDYVQAARPELWTAGRTASDTPNLDFSLILREFHRFEASSHAVTLGISCEACHLGAKQHAQGKLKKPKFFPIGPDVVVRSNTFEHEFGRTHDNVNWACGRCHAGERPRYANGSATWNSTEYTDAMKGSCYSQLTCIRCHNPHEPIGHEWKQTAAQDDAVCLSCHKKFDPAPARMAHTHHPMDHEGSRCMNCHMPRINEGLQEVVRTHTIFSPTDRSMIANRQLNACNLCHVDQTVDWTLTHLQSWYHKSFPTQKSEVNKANHNQAAAIEWLKNEYPFVRLVAADALTRADARWAMPELIEALNDPFLLNRQFARIGMERMLNLKLSDFGYRFYQTAEERLKPLQALKNHLIPKKEDEKSASR